MATKTLAIALCRVSSLDQLENNSLSHQRDNVLKAAIDLGAVIPEDGIWSGQVSSKRGVNYNRKDLHQMLEYCRKNKNVKYLIVQEVDRFMRSPDEQVYFQVKFQQEVGVKIWYADKPELNNDDIYAGLMRYMEGFRAAGSNDERQRKSINGQLKACEDGRYPFSPKPGYMKGVESGIQLLHPERGPALQTILTRLAAHLITPSQAVVELNQSAFVKNRSPYKLDKFRKIATDPFYAGIIHIEKQVIVHNENGLHQPIISRDQHNELVKIISGKIKNQGGPRKNGNPDYPCNNIVNCDLCLDKRNGRVVGSDHSNGKPNSTKVWQKYRCRACKRYIKRDDLHEQIMQRFIDNPIDQDGMDDLMSALNVVWEEREKETQRDIEQLNHRVIGLNNAIKDRVDAATDPENISIKQDILNIIEEKRIEVSDIEDRIDSLTSRKDVDREQFLRFALSFANDMGNRFLTISPDDRLRCKQIIFPGGFYINDNKKVYTPEISPIIRLVSSKRDTRVSQKSLLVRVQGL